MTNRQSSLTAALPAAARSRLARWLYRLDPAAGRAWRVLTRSGFAFMPDARQTKLRWLRHLCRRRQFTARPPWQRPLLRGMATLLWPAAAFAQVLDGLSGLPMADRPTGAGRWLDRGLHMLKLALRDNVPPAEYILYRLHEPGRQQWLRDGLFGPEPQLLSIWLARQNHACWSDIQDKMRFADLCDRHGLPSIPTLAAYRNGARLYPHGPFIPDQPCLWVKDLEGSRGSGAICWRRDGDRYVDRQGNVTIAPDALETLLQQRDCLVQPYLVAHPALDALSTGDAVADFRIISGVDPDGQVAIIATQARLGAGGTKPRWTIFADIGEDGRLRNPLLTGYLPLTHHPDTDAPISDVLVPFWPQALQLVRRAHGGVPAFSRFPLLGWDVAITSEGPVLIETNVGWDGAYPQASGHPLGGTALLAIALAYLEYTGQCD